LSGEVFQRAFFKAHEEYTPLLTLVLAKIQNGLLHVERVALIRLRQSNLQFVCWIFCPEHAGVLGNERADALAGEALNECTLTLDPPIVLALVSEYLDTSRVDTGLFA